MPIHTIPPVYDADSRILILGSFPSVKSREAEFFYAHPQNRFWQVVSAVFGEPFPETVPERKALLLKSRVAVWDVVRCCEIENSSDASIKNAEPNDIRLILDAAKIERIFVNGRTAERLYKRFLEKQTGRSAAALASTSPANAAWSLERLIEAWQVIRL